jgi:molybdate transport system substrate-binding protein
MKIRSLVTAANIAATILLAQSLAAGAAEIRVLSAGGIRPPLAELVLQFERATGHKVVIKFVGGAAVKREIDAGASFDVLVSERDVMDHAIKAGKIVAATRVDIARAGVGVGVRAGAPKPDIASVEAFKRTLLNAKSVAYGKEGMSGIHFLGLLERLGISAEMQSKLRPTAVADGGTFAAIARGEAEIGVGAMATIFAPGVEFVGPLPSELQTYIHFAAGVDTAAKDPQAAVALIKFLTAPAAVPVMKAKGMEPAPQR